MKRYVPSQGDARIKKSKLNKFEKNTREHKIYEILKKTSWCKMTDNVLDIIIEYASWYDIICSDCNNRIHDRFLVFLDDDSEFQYQIGFCHKCYHCFL